MESIYFYLFMATLLHLMGMVIFGHFEEKTPIPKRLSKVMLMIGGTAIFYQVIGGIGALAFAMFMMGMGLVVHITWCRRHDIHPLTAEPKARYYELRGWS